MPILHYAILHHPFVPKLMGVLSFFHSIYPSFLLAQFSHQWIVFDPETQSYVSAVTSRESGEATTKDVNAGSRAAVVDDGMMNELAINEHGVEPPEQSTITVNDTPIHGHTASMVLIYLCPWIDKLTRIGDLICSILSLETASVYNQATREYNISEKSSVQKLGQYWEHVTAKLFPSHREHGMGVTRTNCHPRTL